MCEIPCRFPEEQGIACGDGFAADSVHRQLVWGSPSLSTETPIYDKYQVERKKLFDRAADLLDLYASNYESMTDDAARKILRDWFSLQDDEVALTRRYAKQFEKVLPPAKVIRFVQIENKLDMLLKLKAVANVPLAR